MSPANASFLYGFAWVLNHVRDFAIELNSLAFLLNFFRFAVVGLLLMQALSCSPSYVRFIKKHIYIVVVINLPLIIMLFLTYPKFVYANFSYNYPVQDLLVLLSMVLIFAYLTASFVIMFIEYRQIILAWYRKKHGVRIVQMALFSVPYLIFAQFDPVMIYQDVIRVFVFVEPFLLTNSASISTWVIVFLVALIALMVMFYQSIMAIKKDYSNSKFEFLINQKVSNAEISTSMVLHGLKNQVISANIVAEKLQKEVARDNIDQEKLVEMSKKISELNMDLTEKLSNLHKSVKTVRGIFKNIPTIELMETVRLMIEEKDTEDIVSYDIMNGYLVADIQILAEAVYNIICNAIDAVAEKPDKRVCVQAFTTRTHVVISVVDNGKGMDKAIRKKIFLPFYSSKNSASNWGVGLCYARRVIERHNGDVRCESEVGKGTKFFVTLPRYLEK